MWFITKGHGEGSSLFIKIDIYLAVGEVLDFIVTVLDVDFFQIDTLCLILFLHNARPNEMPSDTIFREFLYMRETVRNGLRNRCMGIHYQNQSFFHFYILYQGLTDKITIFSLKNMGFSSYN